MTSRWSTSSRVAPRKSGGKIEYLCKVASYVSVGIGGPEMRNEWLKPAEIKGKVLAACEIV